MADMDERPDSEMVEHEDAATQRRNDVMVIPPLMARILAGRPDR